MFSLGSADGARGLIVLRNCKFRAQFAIMRLTILPLVCVLVWTAAAAQTTVRPDPEIVRLVSGVSVDSLRADVHTLVGFGTRHTLSSATDPHRGVRAARRWVLEKFEGYAARSEGRMTARIDSWVQPPDGHRINRTITMGNVEATIRGTDPKDDRILIVTAHLDSRRSDVMDSTGGAPGANDDASGVAALLEMARLLSTYPLRASVMLVAVTGEEQGLTGAEHLAREARDGKWNVVSDINNDMIGQSTSSGTDLHDNTRVRVFSEGIPVVETPAEARLRKLLGGENDSRSRELARYLKMTASTYVDNLTVELIYRRDRFLRGGDHEPFQDRGFTAVRMTDYYENFDHQHQDVRTEHGISYGDLERYMDFPYLKKTTSLNLAAIASLATAPSGPLDAKIDVTRLTNATRIFWQKPTYGKAVGYYVLMRETDQPMWQKKFYTDSLEMTLPYSKDNYFFGVQSVGDGGHLSVPVFPGIGR